MLRDKLLTVLKKTNAPKYFIFMDTETALNEIDEKTIVHSLRLGWVFFIEFNNNGTIKKRRELKFTDEVDFWIFVRNMVEKYKDVYLITHNLIFDMTIVKHIQYLEQLGFECKSFYENGFTVIEKWETEEHKLILLNNTNWYPISLKEIGLTFGIEKLDVDYQTEDLELLSEYCHTDVEILVKAHSFLIKYLYENDLGQWSVTLPSLALKIYRHKFMKHEIYLPQEETENKLSRTSYKGGRTECFFVGKIENEQFYKLDINSMYPYIMSIHQFPTRLDGIYDNFSMNNFSSVLRNYCVIANCDVTIKEPCLPYTINKKTCYPTGSFNTTLTTGEIHYLYNRGWINKINTIGVYHCRPIFTDFVEYFYNERLKWKKEGLTSLSYITKLLLNSLYGKFGQQGTIEKIIGQAEPNSFVTTYNLDKESGIRTVIKQVGSNVIEQSKCDTSPTTFTAVASHVTAYARIYLWELIISAGRNNVYYCDTDSLIVNEDGLYRLSSFIDNTDLGCLKLEKTIKTLEIIAPKHYILDEEIKMKGVPKSAEKLENGSYRYFAWPKFNKIYKTGKEEYFNYEVIKTLHPEINYGTQLDNGRIIPFDL